MALGTAGRERLLDNGFVGSGAGFDCGRQRPAAERAEAHPFAFHLLAGDISYADASGRGEATDDYEPTRWDTYFRQIEPVAAQVPGH